MTWDNSEKTTGYHVDMQTVILALHILGAFKIRILIHVYGTSHSQKFWYAAEKYISKKSIAMDTPH